MSAAGSANMEVSSAGKANREPELSCKTCLKRTLKRAPSFATPSYYIINGNARITYQTPGKIPAEKISGNILCYVLYL